MGAEPADDALDEALQLTFPASDPIAINTSNGRGFDAAAWLEQHEQQNPTPALTGDDLVRRYQRGSRSRLKRDALELFEEFVSCFHFRRGTASLGMRPDDSLLEIIAEHLHDYLHGRRSLDAVFAVTARSKAAHRFDSEAAKARFIYRLLQEGGFFQKQAIPMVADALKCSESVVKKLLFGRQPVTKSRKS